MVFVRYQGLPTLFIGKHNWRCIHTQLDPQAEFFTFVAGLSKFMAAFRLSQKTVVNVFFG